MFDVPADSGGWIDDGFSTDGDHVAMNSRVRPNAQGASDHGDVLFRLSVDSCRPADDDDGFAGDSALRHAIVAEDP